MMELKKTKSPRKKKLFDERYYNVLLRKIILQILVTHLGKLIDFLQTVNQNVFV